MNKKNNGDFSNTLLMNNTYICKEIRTKPQILPVSSYSLLINETL